MIVRWVKVSERLPESNDKTSVDFSGDVIVKTFNVEVCSFGIHTVDSSNLDILDEDDEWLEGWNVKTIEVNPGPSRRAQVINVADSLSKQSWLQFFWPLFTGAIIGTLLGRVGVEILRFVSGVDL